MQSEYQNMVEKLKAIAEPTRLKILDVLMTGRHCNCELQEILNLSPNLISHHLKVLKMAKLVEMERQEADARWVYYWINESEIKKLVEQFDGFFLLDRIQDRFPACKQSGSKE